MMNGFFKLGLIGRLSTFSVNLFDPTTVLLAVSPPPPPRLKISCILNVVYANDFLLHMCLISLGLVGSSLRVSIPSSYQETGKRQLQTLERELE